MAYETWQVVACDHCGTTEASDPDSGPPSGWYLLAKMTEPGCWDDDEWHLCSARCVAELTV